MARGSGYQRNGWAWQATVKRILERDDGRCYRYEPTVCTGTAVTADHLVPVAQGGAHEDYNLKAICVPCHDLKSERERRAGLDAWHKSRSRTREPEAHPNRT